MDNDLIETMARGIGGADIGPDMMDGERKWIEGDVVMREPWPKYYERHARAAIEAAQLAGFVIRPPTPVGRP